MKPVSILWTIGGRLKSVPVLFALCLIGCGVPPDNVIRFGIAGAPVTLDPRFATDATSSRANRLLYARLVDFDDSLKPVPSLARWEWLSPVHCRLHLNTERQHFSDGTPLRATDVKATYDSILDPETRSPHRGALKLVREIRVLDGDTVDFHLSEADILFPGYLVIGILPAPLLESGHNFAASPVGSGRFVVDDWPEEGRLRLRRQSDGQLIELLKVKDPTVRVLKLLRGELDFLQNDLPTELIRYLSRQTGISIKRERGSNFTYLGFNLEDERTGDIRLRQAIAYGVDRREIIKHIFSGGARAAESVLTPDHWAGAAGLSPYEHDLQRAKALVQQISPDEPIPLIYKTSSDPFRIRIATIIQSQLKKVGIDVNLKSYDWGTFYGDIKAGRFQMYSLSWVGIKTPDIFSYIFHSDSFPPEGANRGRFADARVDELIERASGLRTLTAQADTYRQLQHRLHEQIPYVPLWYEDHFVAFRDGVAGYTLAHDGNYDGLQTVQKERYVEP